MSCSVLSRAWPMCSFPVMFGGGITVVNGFLLRSASAWKYLFSHHFSYSFSSICLGSYVFASSFPIVLPLLALPHNFYHVSPPIYSCPYISYISPAGSIRRQALCSRNFHTCIKKRPLHHVKGENSAVPPYFIYFLPHTRRLLSLDIPMKYIS